jgi:hypothetical protein
MGVGLADPVMKGVAFGAGHPLALAPGVTCGYLSYLPAPEADRNVA